MVSDSIYIFDRIMLLLLGPLPDHPRCQMAKLGDLWVERR